MGSIEGRGRTYSLRVPGSRRAPLVAVSGSGDLDGAPGFGIPRPNGTKPLVAHELTMAAELMNVS